MNNPAVSRDLTGADLSSHLGLVAGAGKVRISFAYEQVRLRTADMSRNGSVETRLVLVKQPLRDPQTCSRSAISKEEAQRRFPQEWQLFSTYQDVPSDGTPLTELPGMTRQQIAMLAVNDLRSVEDLLDLSSDDAAQLGMETSRARKLAVQWKAKVDEASDEMLEAENYAKAMTAMKALEQRLAKMEEQNIRLEAENKAIRSMGGGALQGAQANLTTDFVGTENYTLDDDDGFLGGGDMVSGNDDLAGEMPADPLAE